VPHIIIKQVKINVRLFIPNTDWLLYSEHKFATSFSIKFSDPRCVQKAAWTDLWFFGALWASYMWWNLAILRFRYISWY